MLSSKMFDDFSMESKDFVIAFGFEITIQQLNDLEGTLLKMFEFNLNVSENEYKQVEECLSKNPNTNTNTTNFNLKEDQRVLKSVDDKEIEASVTLHTSNHQSFTSESTFQTSNLVKAPSTSSTSTSTSLATAVVISHQIIAFLEPLLYSSTKHYNELGTVFVSLSCFGEMNEQRDF